jgi:hypothetical protein
VTRAEAVALAEARFWESMSDEERALFQLCEPRLCMPFKVFHKAVVVTFGRPVWRHEFANPDALKRELCGDRPPPTMQEIIEMIPAEKRALLMVYSPEPEERP